MLSRAYAPIRPVLESEEDGRFQLVVKTDFSNDDRLGSAMSNVLDCISLNEDIKVCGRTDEVDYKGKEMRFKFIIKGKEMRFSRVTLILGGSDNARVLVDSTNF